ncbi:MAG: hypothetical protein KME29_30990 [Calothrix sp. FI2-JRJ7]|nr:hypothetical protein [Calothrix sp. FI2-JRJ7]
MTFQPIASACTASSLQNRFIVSGRGGIPANPSSSIVSQTTWNDMRPISRRRGQNSQNQSYIQNYRNFSQNSHELIEAQGFGVDADGGIALIAFNTVSTPQPAPTNYQCFRY